MKYTKEEIKEEFVRLYGEDFDENRYKSFDQAFEDAWENWCPKWNTDLEDLYETVVDLSDSFCLYSHPSEGWKAEEEYLASQRKLWEEIKQQEEKLAKEEREKNRKIRILARRES